MEKSSHVYANQLVTRISPPRMSTPSKIMKGRQIPAEADSGFRKTPVTEAGYRCACWAGRCYQSPGIRVTGNSCGLSAAHFQCLCDRCFSRRLRSPTAQSDSVGPEFSDDSARVQIRPDWRSVWQFAFQDETDFNGSWSGRCWKVGRNLCDRPSEEALYEVLNA